MILNKRLLLIIIFLAFLTRFIGLSSLPPALNRDEAGIGWNAYSILKTGADEHNQPFPLAFKSIGDFKMPLYIYATTLPIYVFGLTDFSIRFWSALAGVISVIAIYGLVLNLTRKPLTAIVASTLLTFNPWAIFYSRIGFEANLSLAFFLSGLYLFNRYFYPGLILFLLSFLTYSSSLIFIPLFLLALFFIQLKKNLQAPRLIGWLGFSLLAYLIFNQVYAVSLQKSYVTIFSNPTIIDTYNHLRTKIYEQNPLLATTWFNQKFYLFRMFLVNYFKTFSLKFLSLSGGNHPWHQIPGIGNFYLLEIFLALSGLYWLIRKNSNRNLKLILLSWLALAPIPSAITIDAPHTTRSLYLLPVIIILASLGAVFIYQNLKLKLKLKLLLLGLFIYILSFFYAGYQYLKVYPEKIGTDIPLGLKQVLAYLNQHPVSGNLYLTDIHHSTYLYPLIYLKTDPLEFQQTSRWTGPDTLGLSDAYVVSPNIYIVNNLEDMVDPQAVILPKTQVFNNSNFQVVYSSYRYNLYLKKN